jgi:ASC-1-like (ASCH) protein
LPLLFAKKEVFIWLKEGKKTIDIRKGSPKPGDIALFQSGPLSFSMKILQKETGILRELLRLDNFREVIPSAVVLDDAFAYFHGLYGDCDGVFTAYYLGSAE